jgi:hypothetical protein
MAKDGVISGNARSKNRVFSAFAPPMDGLDPFFSRVFLHFLFFSVTQLCLSRRKFGKFLGKGSWSIRFLPSVSER